MDDLVCILALSASLVSFVCTIIFGTINYKDCFHKKFNFLQMFPYEMGDRPQMKITNYFRLVLALFVVSTAVLQIRLLSSVAILSHFLTMIFGTLTVISLASLFLIPMQNAKVHITFFSFSYVLNILTYAFFAYFLKMTPIYVKGNEIYFWLSIVMIVIQVGLLFFPQLYKWYLLEEREENGETTLQRPKVMYLALIEWLSVGFYWIYLLLLIFARTF